MNYEAVVLMTSDYYPFGMVMPGRNTQSGDAYRYAYNGMERDNEVKGDNNSYTTEFRQYDPRLGRWLSLDPAAQAFPHQSPYVGMDNNPVLFNDPLGDSVRYEKFGDRFRVFMARTFNKEFREEFNINKNSVNVHTYDKSKEFTNNDSGNFERLVDAKSCDIECKTNDDGITYSSSVIYYRKGLQAADISSPLLRFPAVGIELGLKLSWNFIKIPLGLTSGLGIGIWNLLTFWNPNLHVGWGMAGFGAIELGDRVYHNFLSYGFGNWENYNMIGMKIGSSKSRGYLWDGLLGFRFGGNTKAPNFIDILPAAGIKNVYYLHFNFVLQGGRERYLNREDVIDVRGRKLFYKRAK